MSEETRNVGARWARAGVASAPDGLSWRILVPGGADPAAAARACGRSVVSAGLMETGPDGVERLVRSAHVPMRDYDDQRLLFRLRRLAVRLPRLRQRDLEQGLSIEATPLEWPETPGASLRGRLARAARGAGVDSPLIPIAARLAQRGLAYATYQLHSLSGYDRWRVGLVNAPIHRFLDPLFRPQPEWFAPPGEQQYAADPFALPASAFDANAPAGAVRVFYEHFDYDAPVGRIDSVLWTPEHGFGAPREELSLDTHLSYPNVFEHEGSVWIAPESASTDTLTAYRWDGQAWTDPTVLIEDFRALDATFVEHEGRWWVFATNAREEPVHELHAWWADNRLGPYTPHPGNPLLLDPRAGRPGGSMFHHEGRLYRVAQDCSRTYGGAVVLAEVTALDATSFGQRVVRRLTPDSVGGGTGLHTLTACGDVTLLDVKDATSSASETRRRLARRLGLG